MRIKIEGEITAERLAEALQVASERFRSAMPGSQIYGANLYLTAFDADGQAFDIGDGSGSLCITLAAKAGDVIKPALTAEGAKRRQESKVKLNEARAAELVEQERARKEWDLQRAEMARQHKLDMARYESLNTQTEQLVSSMPERFIAEINAVVESVWSDLKPVERNGKPKILPVFQISPDGLIITSDTWKTARRVLNPILRTQYGEPVPHWAHDAWAEASKRIIIKLDELSQSK